MLTQKEIVEVREFNNNVRIAQQMNLGKGCIEVVSEDEPRDESCIYVRAIENPETGEREFVVE
jgi:hypothetical protein